MSEPSPFSEDANLVRLTHCPEAVAVLGDSHLLILAQSMMFSRLSFRWHVVSELLVRQWLYAASPSEDVEEGMKWISSSKLFASHVKEFKERMKPLRDHPQQSGDDTPQRTEAFRFSGLTAELEVFWAFVIKRIASYLDCDGLIPVVLDGREAVAVPFTFQKEKFSFTFVDAAGLAVDSWISSAKSVWETLGGRIGIRLSVQLGPWLDDPSGNARQKQIEGGSFALPVLYAATRTTNEDLHPLQILCTGAVSNFKLKAIEGRDAKAELAGRIGAKFIAPGLGEEWSVADGQPVREALLKVVQASGKELNLSTLAVDRLLNPPSTVPWSRRMFDYHENYIERPTHFRTVGLRIRNLLRSLQAGTALRRALWITGPSGCGKTAFAVSLARRLPAELDEIEDSAGIPDFTLVPHFFGAGFTSDQSADCFLRTAADQLEQAFGLNLEEHANDLSERLRESVRLITNLHGRQVVFLLDGIDDASPSAWSQILEFWKLCPAAGWVVVSQNTPDIDLGIKPWRRNAPFELGGLGGAEIGEMVTNLSASLSIPLPLKLRDAIILRAAGIPQFVRCMLEAWRVSEGTLTAENLPESLGDLYLDQINKLAGRDRTPWRRHVWNVCALLATTPDGTPVSETVIRAAAIHLTPSPQHDEVIDCLRALSPFLQAVSDSTTGRGRTLWTYRHASLRDAIVKSPFNTADIFQGEHAWTSLCQRWNEPTLIGEVRIFCLRHGVDRIRTLFPENDSLALNGDFLELQAEFLGRSAPLETMKRELICAFQHGDWSSGGVLMLRRAKAAARIYSEHPFEALLAHENDWASELVSHIENQSNRTLWYLGLAAWHSNGGRLEQAAEVLDRHLTASAWNEDLEAGASICAALFMTFLTEVPTYVFQWEGFLSRLTDESKALAGRRLAVAGKMQQAWRMLTAIKNDKAEDNARLEIMRWLARHNPQSALRQLDWFANPVQHAWALQELVAAHAEIGRWTEAFSLLEAIPRTFPRQRAKAWAGLAALTKRNLPDRYQDMWKKAMKAVDEAMDERPLAMAEVGMVLAEYEWPDTAQQCFARALEYLSASADARQINPAQRGKKPSKIIMGRRYVAVVRSLSASAKLYREFTPLLSSAVEKSVHYLLQSNEIKTRCWTTRQLVKVLGYAGHFDEIKWLLFAKANTDLLDDFTRSECHSLFRAYKVLHRTSDGKDTVRGAPRSDEVLADVGRKAFGFDWTEGRNALETILRSLYMPKHPASKWGKPRIVMAAAESFARSGNSVNSMAMFAEINSALENINPSFRAWELINLGDHAARSGAIDMAGDYFDAAQTLAGNSRGPELELLTQIEERRHRYAIIHPSGHRQDILRRRQLIRSKQPVLIIVAELIKSAACLIEARRTADLTEIAEFIKTRLQNENFKIQAGDRLRLAGEMAAECAKHGMKEGMKWVRCFIGLCKRIVRENPDLAIPDTVIRAQLVDVARRSIGLSKAAACLAKNIRSGKEKSKCHRDLAILAISQTDFDSAKALCAGLVQKRSEYLADIAEAVVGDAMHMGADQRSLLGFLAVRCSDYDDSAYRMLACLIRSYPGDSQSIAKVLDWVGFTENATEVS